MTEPMKTADEFLNSKTHIQRWDDYIPRSARYITKVMDEFAAQQVAAERERIKNELKEKIKFEDPNGFDYIWTSEIVKLIDSL